MTGIRLLLLGAGLSSAAATASAQAPREPGSELTVFLATMGPGDAVWEKFGHNAIWIRDAVTRTTIAYNYGMFDFRQERFIPRLVAGDMLYSMGVDEAEQQLAAYSYYNRSVTLQRLDLTAAQRHSLREFLEWNWLPENREYPYDPFRDNCSTRVRDALDRALGGALRNALGGRPTGTTYRSHSLRLTAAAPATYAGLLLALGLPTDEPIDAWEESFIPMELARHLRSIRLATETGDTRPLVAEETVAFAADRADPLASPPDRFLHFLLAGLAFAGTLLLLTRRARTGRFARASLGLAIFFWALTTGFFGVLLALLWLFTDHTAAYPNTNLLQVNPLGLLLAAAAPLAVVGSRLSRVARVAWPTALVLLALSLLGAVLYAVPSLRQESGALIAFVLPVHAAVVMALYRFRHRPASPGADADPRVAAAAAA
ncbi:MAG TPA: DUF4105 domain-containing protein [Longimicrobiales bacterium]